MAYYIMFLWIPGWDRTRSKVTGNFLVNALHAFHRFNRHYHVKNPDVLLNACKDIGLAENLGKTRYMEVRHCCGMMANEHITVGSNSYENL